MTATPCIIKGHQLLRVFRQEHLTQGWHETHDLLVGKKVSFASAASMEIDNENQESSRRLTLVCLSSTRFVLGLGSGKLVKVIII
jgi:hypothetical protein